jgi:ribonucleoside-diphosphate reductase alpha chain
MPKHHRDLGLKVSTSNLCSEITLPTGRDHLGNDRTAVCCLSSLNLETWDEWKGEKGFIEDVMRFLDNVLQDFIDRAEPGMERAAYSAMRERSVGLGVMGFHSFLQARGLPSKARWPRAGTCASSSISKAQVDEASMQLAIERGPCPDAADMGVMERFSCKMAIAPTASISIICGGTSACIEPMPANIYTHKTLSGSFSIRNPYLEKLLIEKSEEFGCGVELDPREGRLGPASRLPQPGGKGLLQDQLRDRPALADRAQPPTARPISTSRPR